MKARISLYVVWIFVLLVSFASPVSALPQPPFSVYGKVFVNADQAPEGTQVRAFYGSELLAVVEVASDGFFYFGGNQDINVDDPTTDEVEGCVIGQPVVFTAKTPGGVEQIARPEATCNSGNTPLRHDLTVSPPEITDVTLSSGEDGLAVVVWGQNFMSGDSRKFLVFRDRVTGIVQTFNPKVVSVVWLNTVVAMPLVMREGSYDVSIRIADVESNIFQFVVDWPEATPTPTPTAILGTPETEVPTPTPTATFPSSSETEVPTSTPTRVMVQVAYLPLSVK